MEVSQAAVKYLTDIAPVVGVMGIILYFLYRDYRDAINYARLNDKENLETLIDISNFLTKVLDEARSSSANIINTIKNEGESVRKHIDHRIESYHRRTE